MTARLPDAARTADAALAEIAASFDYLLYVSPVDSAQAWKRFAGAAFEQPPSFAYRDVDVELDALRRRLDGLPVDDVDDEGLAGLLEGKRWELHAYLDLLATRGSERFLERSIAISGAVDEELRSLAEDLLDRAGDEVDEPEVDARRWCARAEREIAAYRRQDPAMKGSVHLRTDITSLMVSGSEVLVPEQRVLSAQRAEALVHHEVGVHLVTWWNGSQQPLTLLATGLAGFVEAEEGLGVLAEWAVGGMTAERLRELAARVVAAGSVIEGASFLDTFTLLHEDRGLPAHRAFALAERVHRGGGLVKDAAYLRGVVRIIERLSAGGDLEPLLVGKASLDHVDDVEHLLDEGVLDPPRVRPRWLDEGADRLAQLTGDVDAAQVLLRGCGTRPTG